MRHRALTPTSFRRALALVFLGLPLLSAACKSTGGSSGDGGPNLLVAMRDYETGRVFELASESHTDRVEYYSQPRGDAARKVQADEVMKLLIEHLRDEGYNRFSQNGGAPTRGGGAINRSFEVEENGTVTHWLIGSRSTAEERLAFNECLEQFLGLYNISASYQTVQNPDGHAFFDRPETKAANVPKR